MTNEPDAPRDGEMLAVDMCHSILRYGNYTFGKKINDENMRIVLAAHRALCTILQDNQNEPV